ncbi:ABC transporter permease [Planosporangium thailandense]|uniref:ABC transporter permease n=2 Tax=Planosporangium thailandense TaxID=765197 RepID=A0ABX0Y4C9_9ACTN|nr:ABC transporter permease [Planosporangium thailandense]
MTSHELASGGGPVPTGGVGRRVLGNASLVVGVVMTVALVAVAALSLVWTPADPNLAAPADRLLPAGSHGHLLGTDALGRDIASALMVGARTSITVAAGAALLGVVLGTISGLTAAAARPVVSESIMRGVDILLAMPGIVFALVLAATVGAGVGSTIFALTVFFVPSFTRVVRAAALRVLAEDYVTAAELYGRRKVFILARHVLPNIFSVLIVQFTLYFAAGILTEAGLSYLGVGVNRPAVSWGMLLKEAQDTVGVSGPLAIWPGLAIVFAVLGLNMLGDGLRDVLDPRLRKRSS